jgi:large subunit ribosomal protein L1
MSSYGAALPSAARGILSSCRLPLREKSMTPAFSVFQQVRGVKSNPQAKGKGKKKEAKSDRKGPREFQQKNLKDMEQYALCDAMRYVCLFGAYEAH